MASPLNKNKEELTLYLIEESYKVYKANFAGSRDFEAPIPRYRDRNPPLESLPPGTDFFSRNPDIPPPPPPPPPSLPDPIKTPAKKYILLLENGRKIIFIHQQEKGIFGN